MNLLGLKYREQRSSGPEFYLSLELNEKAFLHLPVGSLTVQKCVKLYYLWHKYTFGLSFDS
jgi:hypothetical protein